MAVLLFDIDGTLLTTPGVGRRVLESVFSSRCEGPINTESISFAGRTDPAIVRDILRVIGRNPFECESEIEDVLDDYAEHFQAHIEPEMVHIFPGVRNLLELLASESSVHLGLLTGNLQRTAEAKLGAAGLAEYFGFGAFGSDHEDRDRLPAFARRRADRFLGRPVNYSEMVVIGDTAHDVQCGRAVGAATVGVCTGYVPRHTLVDARPDLLLEDFRDPEPLLEFIAS